MTAPETTAGPRPPAVTAVEQHGIDRIPDAERDARPLDLFRLSFGGANTFATAFLGSFPILFGLSFWQGLAATVLGLVVGDLLLSPMSLFGPINGTNNAVSSSAHLGVHGRIVGSFVTRGPAGTRWPTARSRCWCWWSACTASGSCCWSTRSRWSRPAR